MVRDRKIKLCSRGEKRKQEREKKGKEQSRDSVEKGNGG